MSLLLSIAWSQSQLKLFAAFAFKRFFEKNTYRSNKRTRQDCAGIITHGGLVKSKTGAILPMSVNYLKLLFI